MAVVRTADKLRRIDKLTERTLRRDGVDPNSG